LQSLSLLTPQKDSFPIRFFPRFRIRQVWKERNKEKMAPRLAVLALTLLLLFVALAAVG
jgi:hypothetical protein